jgi:pimeloyl-ACP methyl ester carboxylesterase
MQTTRGRGDRPAIVLVHGAWADALSWQGVIPPLQRGGYDVVAVENPLTSFADDVATTRRALKRRTQRGLASSRVTPAS